MSNKLDLKFLNKMINNNILKPILHHFYVKFYILTDSCRFFNSVF